MPLSNSPPNLDLDAWLSNRRRASGLSVHPIALAESTEWSLVDGAISRVGGGFFTVRGMTVESGGESRDQPFIDQPEIGILGFLTRRREGALELDVMVQAKTEPGNVGGTQIAPTVQATESNYTRKHAGSPTAYLHRFRHPRGDTVTTDVLQSEQGSVFLGKYNRNMVVTGDDSDVETDRHAWIPISRLLKSLRSDYTVNTDARSVLVCSDWSALKGNGVLFAADGWIDRALRRSYACVLPDGWKCELDDWLDGQRRRSDLMLRPTSLEGLRGWTQEPGGFSRRASGTFVRTYDVRAADREVAAWQQPLFGESAPGRVALIAQVRRGVLHFLVCAAVEPGFRDGVQLGPVQRTGSSRVGPGALLEAGDVLIGVNQSEEGGRFYRTVNRYEVRIVPETFACPAAEDYRWLTLGRIHALARVPDYLTNELRSAVSLLLSWL